MVRLSLLASIALITTGLFAQTRIISHVTPIDGDFKTDFVLVNPSEEPAPFTLTPYAQDGTVLADVIGELAPGETRFLSTLELFGGQVSHFTLNDEDTIEITSVYRDFGEANSSAHVSGVGTSARRWQIYPGELDDVIDGLAVVNTDTVSRTIEVRQLDTTGRVIQRSAILDLDPMSKGLYIYGDFVRMPGTYFEVFSEGPITVTALRFAAGGAGARFFWATAAVPLPALVENQAPVITGQADLSVVSGNALEITLADLTVDDPDNDYPADFSLAVMDGADYTRDGNTITPVQGFTGTLSVDVTVNDGQADSPVFTCMVEVTEAQDPRVGKVAVLRTNSTYGVSGRVVIADERTLRFENFSYSGDGPDVRIYVGIDMDFIGGEVITDSISDRVFDNETWEVPLPDDVTLDDFNSISIWCTIFSVSFSEGVFE